MANTIKLGNGNWATKEGSLLAYNDENNNFKPLPFTTTRASSATVVNKQGLIETVGSGIPRIDFSDDANGALLLEPTSKNIITYSEDFSNVSWTKTGSSIVTPNTMISPDGTLNADSFTFTTSTSDKIQQFATVVALAEYTISCYIKSDSNIIIKIGGAAASTPINVTTEWVRHTVTQTNGAGTAAFPQLGSNGTAGTVYIYGAQLEENSYSTSYIKNEGTAAGVTRVADTASGSGNSTVINSTEGVLYAEISALANDGTNRFISLTNGVTDATSISLAFTTTINQIRALVDIGYSLQASITHTVSSVLDFNKVAFSFKENDFALWINGVKVGTDPNGSVPPASYLSDLGFLRVNALSFYGKCKDSRVYTTVLSDAELISLTTI